MNTEIVAQNDGAGHLVRYESARKALREARNIDEVKDIRDKTQALAAYARQAKDTEMSRWVSEIKIRAERRCGELLKETAKNGERVNRKTANNVTKNNQVTSCNLTQKLDNYGIGKGESHRYQKIAAIPEPLFEEALQKSAEKSGVPTTAGVRRAAAELERVLREGAEMVADLEENSRRAKARNAADPDFQANQQWLFIIGAVERCVKEMNKILQQPQIHPCPPDKYDGLINDWVTVSDFITQYGRAK
jgi:hypothetical protein